MGFNMLTMCINRNVLMIAALAVAACVGLTAVSLARPAKQSTYTVAASHTGHVAPKATCHAKADKLNALREATAPIIP
jgi:hypothetical protein